MFGGWRSLNVTGSSVEEVPLRAMPLEIRVLGPLEVLVDGSPMRVDTRKALAIVALLAVEGRPYARDELAAMFWPESDDESARGAFRRTLSVLRSALGERWLQVFRVDRGVQEQQISPVLQHHWLPTGAITQLLLFENFVDAVTYHLSKPQCARMAVR